MHKPPKEKKNKKNKTSSAPKGALFFAIFLFILTKENMKWKIQSVY